VIQLTQQAEAAVTSAITAARRFDPTAQIRLARAGAGVTFEFMDSPDAADTSYELGDLTLYVDSGLDGVVDTGDHNAPVLRPHDKEQT
jgi:hypothetical protein